MTAPTLNHYIYNVSSGRPVANREFAVALEAALPGAHVDLAPGRGPDSGPEDPYLDITRLITDTGFASRFDVVSAAADYVGRLADNPARTHHALSTHCPT